MPPAADHAYTPVSSSASSGEDIVAYLLKS
jgi:hypothetical protein